MSLILSRPRHYKVNSSWSKWRGNKQVSRCDSSSPWLFGSASAFVVVVVFIPMKVYIRSLEFWFML